MLSYFFVVTAFCKFGLSDCRLSDIESGNKCRFNGAANCSLWFYTRKGVGADIRGGEVIDTVKADSLEAAEKFFTSRLEAGSYGKKIAKFKEKLSSRKN